MGITSNIKKIIISENGGYLGIMDDKDGKYGLTQFMFAITSDNDEERKNIKIGPKIIKVYIYIYISKKL
jgi:hypothetical protein